MQRGKEGKKGKKSRITDKLQSSLDRIIDVLDLVSNIIVIVPKMEDLFNYGKCLPLLTEVPDLVKGSHLYFFGYKNPYYQGE